MDKLRRELGADTAEAFVGRVVPALLLAYDTNVKRYRPKHGDDEIFFGVAVWRNATHLLGEHCQGFPGSNMQEGIVFQMSLEGRTFRFYKMPPRLGDNIDAFTLGGSKIRVAQGQTNDDQLCLFAAASAAVGGVGVVEARGEPEFPRLVVLHQGTPIDGLRWVAVGAPSMASNRSWHWVEKIYDASWTSVGVSGDVTPLGARTPTTRPLDIRLKPELQKLLHKDNS